MMQSLSRAIAAVLLVFVMGQTAHADETGDLEGRPITAIELRGASADETSRRVVGIPLGAPFSRALVRSALERMVSRGTFSDVQFDVLDDGDGVRILVHIAPRLIVTRAEVIGNHAIEDDELERTLQVAAGDEIRGDSLEEIAARVVDAYAEQGFPSTTAQATLRDTDNAAQKVLVVTVHEGEPARLSRIVFTGDGPSRAIQSDIRSEFNLDVGSTLDRRAINDGVHAAEARLRELGFLEAVLGPANLLEGGVLVVASAVGPHYEIILRGHDPLTREQIAETLKLGEERLIGAAGARTLRERVLDMYQRSGFVDATVDVVRERSAEPNSVRLVIAIHPGAQVEVIGIAFPGATHFQTRLLRDQVVSYLEEDLEGSTFSYPVDSEVATRVLMSEDLPGRERGVAEPFLVEPGRVYYEPTYTQAIEHIKELYQADGYLSARVGPAVLNRSSPARAAVSIPVVEGPRTMLFATDIQGNTSIGARELLVESGLTDGAPFSYLSLEEGRRKMLELYREHGYFFARVEAAVRFSGDRTRAEVTFQVVERFPMRIREIVIHGLTRTSESLVRGRISLHEGDLYRPSAARESEERLLDLGVFTGVTILPEDEDLAEREKRIIITVSERRSQYLESSGGVSTGQGVRASVEYGYTNLFNYAISAIIRVQLGYQFFFVERSIQERYERLVLGDRLGQRVSIGFAAPYIPALPNTRASLDLVYIRANERDFGYNKFSVIPTLAYRPSRHFTLSISEELEQNNLGLFINKSLQQLAQETTDLRLKRLLLVPEGSSWLAATRASITIDQRDNPFTPMRGFLLSSSVEWARTLSTENSVFFSNFIKLSFTANGYIPIMPRVTLALQFRIGRIVALDPNSQTYPNRQFFLGGVETMRGYPQDAMIPQELADLIARNQATSDAILRGGDAFMLLRAELRFPLFGPLQGGIFFDLGNLWAEAANLNPLKLRPTAGFGVRFETPVGPIAFDYGFVLLRRSTPLSCTGTGCSFGEPYEPFGTFHFSIGLF
ncbi:MAG: BamA/TamA family outer membrane protein [Sandaracinaceae bacterium]|nr:BamA/TamA family outer membrane protein [Sandaracinaceae bacterium]